MISQLQIDTYFLEIEGGSSLSEISACKLKVETRYLLSFEIMGHKVLLEFLIGIVDAELLQVVGLKTLKAVHIQNSWRLQRRGLCELVLRRTVFSADKVNHAFYQ